MSCHPAICKLIHSMISSSSTADDSVANKDVDIKMIGELSSAQQCVLLLDVSSSESHLNDTAIFRALQEGNGRLILRIWKGSARWWNLNNNDDKNDGDVCSPTCQLAKAEISGYRIAYRALQFYNQRQEKEKWPSTNVVIPKVLYFSHDNDNLKVEKNDKETQIPWPWAIFSYVGKSSIYFPTIFNATTKTNGLIDNNHEPSRMNRHCCEINGENLTVPLKDSNNPNSKEIYNNPFRTTSPTVTSNNNHLNWILDDQFAKNMVKVRHEFGFDEPHPRHGRVSIDQSLTYALDVIDSVILPLHSSFFLAAAIDKLSCTSNSNKMSSWMHENDVITTDFQNISWNTLNSKKSNNHDDTDLLTRPFRYEDMLSIYSKIMFRLEESINGSDGDNAINTSIHILKRGLDTLKNEYADQVCLERSNGETSLPAVLCHMDLQPQNMMLKKTVEMCDNKDVPKIAIVLDWEEACFADPRFELLLICRKVVANRTQADHIWKHYCTIMKQRFSHPKSPEKYNFGSIEPWLKLETVHSLLTLLMQSMNLVNGGRSPWEEKPDLKGKIEREFSRLVDLGWDFCVEAI